MKVLKMTIKASIISEIGAYINGFGLRFEASGEEAPVVLPKVDVSVGISDNWAVGHELRHGLGAQEVVLHGVHRHSDAGVGQGAHVTRPCAGSVHKVVALDEALVGADARDGAVFRNYLLHLAVRYEGDTAGLDINSTELDTRNMTDKGCSFYLTSLIP